MDYRFADRVKMFKSSAIREISEIIAKGNDVISFAGGFPYEPYFPQAELEQAFDKVFASGKSSLQYGMTSGFMPLREKISERVKAKGIQAAPVEVLLTTGSQQSIDLFSRIMLSPGDVVLTENPTFLAAVQAFESYEAKVIGVQSDKDGMDPEDLAKKLKEYKPKFIYVVPTFSNPEGKVWSNERRVALLKLAEEHNTLILEDDPYGELQFNAEETYTPIAAMDTEKKYVIYTSSFSKTVVPSLRVGWVTGPQPIMKVLAQIKEAADLMSSPLNQQALYHLLNDFDLDGHIRMLCQQYHQHMLVMQDYLKKLDSCKWVEPKGGMFIWLEVDENIHATELLTKVVPHGVAFIPGAPFYVDSPRQNTMRLNFTNSNPERIKLGMERLTEAFQQALK
ncbi:PLP-dependent aminotransferase family protein [Brevibacillus invocatus]|uniref:aminotransferase-like domain-containing protein n=1 Tax=Brevibacillus invocatus TaxID=173959 RepID=UPI00203FB027|nr:PLP-dependent aminotransferase family protein [Brevibacillus invocatus]MCM3079138.1 PLP-dependent aminotransferase family protein [Brevibacillus invocatus]MCM3429319.1 PLP-dependent aminotransferase family protein [Brevibacillus invocatus]